MKSLEEVHFLHFAYQGICGGLEMSPHENKSPLDGARE